VRKRDAVSCTLFGIAIGLAAPVATGATISVACVRGAQPDTESLFTCTRGDTRAAFTAVPDGMYLHLLDFQLTPNDDSTAGAFSSLIGRDDADDFPTHPSIHVTSRALGSKALHFRTPPIILREGESLALSNLAHSQVPIGAYVSGFLSETVRVPEPAAAAVAVAAIVALGALRLRGRRSRALRCALLAAAWLPVATDASAEADSCVLATGYAFVGLQSGVIVGGDPLWLFPPGSVEGFCDPMHTGERAAGGAVGSATIEYLAGTGLSLATGAIGSPSAHQLNRGYLQAQMVFEFRVVPDVPSATPVPITVRARHDFGPVRTSVSGSGNASNSHVAFYELRGISWNSGPSYAVWDTEDFVPAEDESFTVTQGVSAPVNAPLFFVATVRQESAARGALSGSNGSGSAEASSTVTFQIDTEAAATIVFESASTLGLPPPQLGVVVPEAGGGLAGGAALLALAALRRRGTRRRASGAALAAALLADAPMAAAQGFLRDLVVVSEIDANDGTSGFLHGSVPCPTGTDILGGGVRAVNSGLRISASRPGGASFWIATALDYEPVAGPWELEVTAICGRVADHAIAVEETTADSTSPKLLTAACPEGTTVLGGGALPSGSNGELAITSSAPDGNGWFARAYEVAPTSDDWHLIVYAICGNVPDRVVIGEQSSVSSTNTRTALASCPAGLVAISGGAFVGFDGREALSGTYPLNEDAWYSRAFEPIPHGENWTLRTSVICAPESRALLANAVALLALWAARRRATAHGAGAGTASESRR
jgi:hypothetical protein